MSLKNYLDGWRCPIPLASRVPNAPPRFSKVASKWVDRLQNLTPIKPKPQDLELIYRTIKKHYQDNQSIDQLPARVLRKAPWVIFSHPEGQPGELTRNTRFTADYLNWVAQQTTNSALSILLRTFLYHYPMKIATFVTWRDGIKSALNNANRPRLNFIKERCSKYYLLENEGAMLFSQCLADGLNPVSIWKEAGFDGQLSEGVFAKLAYYKLLSHLQEKLSTGQPQDLLLEKVLLLSTAEQGTGLRYPSLGKYLANALLIPYAEGRASETHRQKIQDYLLGKMGDPRIVMTGWAGVEDRAKQLMFGWLVKTTLEEFFNILSATADPIWNKRKNFWSRYLHGGHISEAWAILGSDARGLARTHFRDLGYGYLRGAASNQSVLLMKIADQTIAEWSHSGAYRRFSLHNNTAPFFYRTCQTGYYNRQELYGNPDSWIPHSKHWQNKVKNDIYHNTNIWI